MSKAAAMALGNQLGNVSEIDMREALDNAIDYIRVSHAFLCTMTPDNIYAQLFEKLIDAMRADAAKIQKAKAEVLGKVQKDNAAYLAMLN